MGFWLLVLGLRFGVMVRRVLCFCVDVDVYVDFVSFYAPGQNAIISNEIILSDPTQRSRSLRIVRWIFANFISKPNLLQISLGTSIEFGSTVIL